MGPIKEFAGRFTNFLFGSLLYFAVLAALVTSVPEGSLQKLNRSAVLALGVIATWRYGWWALHLLRGIYYRSAVFPKIRARAEVLRDDEGQHAFFLITSYRIGAETTIRVYRAAFEAALAHPGRSTIIASIVEMADQRLVKRLFESIVGPEATRSDRIALEIVRIGGTGKRDALAFGFRAVAKHLPHLDDVVMVIDGDSIVPPDLVRRCAPLLKVDPQIGALTTDEVSEVYGSHSDGIFRHWYAMRFAQRQIQMSSLGLSGRVLTLTGRMSMFRATIVCDPEFIRQVEVDYIDHWRLGRIRLLTGDDKSSWFALLKRGDLMIYVPDVKVKTIEEVPDSNFFKASTALMTRWFGNMLRTSSRAIALGPRRIGWFTWWCLVDQRISMWTSLAGAIFAILGSVFFTPYALIIYVAWIMGSRWVVTAVLLTVRKDVSLWYPFLLWYNQVIGSVIKTYILCHMRRQKWTRQSTRLDERTPVWRQVLMSASSHYVHLLSLMAMVLGIATWMGITAVPQLSDF